MNPTLRALNDLIKNNPEIMQQVCVQTEKEVKSMVTMLKEINEPKGEVGSMEGIKNFSINFSDNKIEPRILNITAETLIIQAIWAVVFNKTMPEAMEMYKRFLKEQGE